MSDTVLAVVIAGAFTLLGTVATLAVALRTSKSNTEAAEKKIEADTAKEQIAEWKALAEKYEADSERCRNQAYQERARADALQLRLDEAEDKLRKLKAATEQSRLSL